MNVMDLFTPSHFLFPLAQLSSISEDKVSSNIEQLHSIYSKDHILSQALVRHINHNGNYPFSRSSTKGTVEEETIIDSGYASAESEDDCSADEEDGRENLAEALQRIRNDAYERDFAIRWLSGFIARASTWAYANSSHAEDVLERREAVIEKAASVLTICAGSDEEEDEALDREFRFTVQSSGKDFTVMLNDLVAPEDHSSVGLQSWASSIYFAKMLCQEPSTYGLVADKSLRVLELGAGTGLLSLTAANILDPSCELIATDYHLDVLANLQRNVDLNFPSTTTSPISVRALDWQYPFYTPPLHKPFDIILAADVVYEPSHPDWIKNCVENLLARPSVVCPEGGVFWMVIAVRNIGRHEGLASSVFKSFPITIDVMKAPSTSLSLRTTFVLDMERSNGVGRADESGYRLFKICWA